MSGVSSSMKTLFITAGLAALSVWVGGMGVFLHRMNYSVTIDQLVSWAFSTKCQDFHESCATWAAESECTLNPSYMSSFCRKSCGTCSSSTVTENTTFSSLNDRGITHDDKSSELGEVVRDEAVEDGDEEALDDDESDDTAEDGDDSMDDQEADEDLQRHEAFADEVNEDDYHDNGDEIPEHKLCKDDAAPNVCSDMVNECDSNAEWMHQHCRRTCGLCPCSNAHKLCKFWAREGECNANPNYMLSNCAKACKTCSPSANDNDELVEGADGKQIVCKDKQDPGFCAARLADGECQKNPGWMTVFCGKTCGHCHLLRQEARCVPEVFNDTSYVYDDVLKKGDVTRVFERILAEIPTAEVVLRPPKGPWVIKMPNFVTDLERERFLSLTLPHVRRSTDQGSFNEEGVQEQIVSSGRTSSNAWCTSECSSDPIVQGLTKRISDLTRVPVKNFESFQVLQYKEGQKYNVHHDSSDEDRNNLSGPRILTFFIYLSDVEEGGETFFDKLGLKVKPQKNMAILWPSVLDDEPRKVDWRTTHAALPVIKGEKLAANIWMHQNDFATPNLWGCTGAFDESD